MGTNWSLHAVAAGVDVRAIAEQAFADVIGQMSQWEPGSELSRFNNAAPGQWHEISPEFARVMDASRDIQRLSRGAFDPGLGVLTEAWGYGAGTGGNHPQPASQIFSSKGWDFDSQHNRIKRQDGVAFDLSGIAKGFAVDLVVERLLAASVRHFLIEIGGELRGEGIDPSGQPWWVDIAMPPTCDVPPYRLALHDLSIATSGNYQRGRVINGAYFSHSFDPKLGAPIRHNVSSVSVIHRSCMMADGWATALTIMGRSQAMALAEQHQLAVCIIDGGDEFISAAWRAMLS